MNSCTIIAGILPLAPDEGRDLAEGTHDTQDRTPVAQFVVRDLEEEVKARLKRRAKHRGRSMEEEIRHILRNAVAGAVKSMHRCPPWSRPRKQGSEAA